MPCRVEQPPVIVGLPHSNQSWQALCVKYDLNGMKIFDDFAMLKLTEHFLVNKLYVVILQSTDLFDI